MSKIRELTDKVAYWLKSHFHGAYSEAHNEILKAQQELNEKWAEEHERLVEAMSSVDERVEGLFRRIGTLESNIRALEYRFTGGQAKSAGPGVATPSPVVTVGNAEAATIQTAKEIRKTEGPLITLNLIPPEGIPVKAEIIQPADAKE